ncbi:hypothetical protein HQ544_01365 [Candidatus Falkowbacteria bacterium]|nr:hypothetical protein [Candidatus Falkowbacteria bacterium]
MKGQDDEDEADYFFGRFSRGSVVVRGSPDHRGVWFGGCTIQHLYELVVHNHIGQRLRIGLR